MPDPGVPLCSAAQFNEGAFADLAVQYQGQALSDVLLEATRICEDMAGRRLAPFTVTNESHRAEGVDPDELGETGGIPMSLQGTLGMSYASALNNVTLVRHISLDEYPVRYPDMWAYSDVSLTIALAFGGTQLLNAGGFTGPDQDSGHIWFQLGTFLPIGSMVYATYSGGYTVATPSSLVRACKYVAASIIVRELNPDESTHDPGVLMQDAEEIMERWGRA